MTVDLKSPRPDIVFIRRRLKLGESSPVQVAIQPVTGGLNLNRNRNNTGPVETQTVATVRKSSVPTLNANKVLTEKNKSVRLTAMQSSVGTLTIANSTFFAWETKNRETGFIYRDPMFQTEFQSVKSNQIFPALPEIATPTYGNRQLMEYENNEIYLTLRHVKKLRRAVIHPTPGQPLIVKTSTGKTVTVEYSENTVLYVSVVDSKLELRIEKVTGDRNIYESFRIGTYTPITH